MSEDADVVVLHPWRDLEDDDAPLHRTPKTTSCSHREVRLVQDAHRVFCRRCDAEVDPFAVLVRFAGDWDHWVNHRKQAMARAHAAEERLKETLRLERNARSRIKRLDPTLPLPEVPWGEASL